MITIGNRHIPKAFIKSIDYNSNSVIFTFYMGHKVKIKFKDKKTAEMEYKKALNKYNKSIHLCSIL